jgi:hypothetical protein
MIDLGCEWTQIDHAWNPGPAVVQPVAMTTGSPNARRTAATFFGCWYAWRFS